jgi:Conjugative transposon protein TcpC
VSNGINDTVRVRSSSVGSLLRGVGRAALWTAVALLLVRGVVSVLSAPAPQSATRPNAVGAEEATNAFAVRFARTYLSEPTPEALNPFLAEGARIGRGRPAPVVGIEVAQAEVVRGRELGGGLVVVTVACELRDARTLYLAVPIARSGAGEVAALGAPSIVAVPAVAGVEASRPQPLVGPDGAAIESLVAKFLPVYLSATEESELSYLLAPGAAVIPLAGSLELLGAAASGQIGSGVGPRRTVIASARVRDPASGATYPLAYRLELVKRSRWYVEGVQGALP